MRLLAALLGGVAVYLAMALFLGVAPQVQSTASSRPQVSKRQLWLVQAGSELTPRQFWSGSVAVAVAAFLLLWMVTQSVVIALVPALVVGLGPRTYFTRERRRRIAEIQQAWPDGIRDVLAHVERDAGGQGQRARVDGLGERSGIVVGCGEAAAIAAGVVERTRDIELAAPGVP